MIFPCIFLVFTVAICASSKRNNVNTIFSWGTVLLFIILFAFLVSVNSATPDYFAYLKYFTNSPDIFDVNFLAYAKTTHTEIGYDSFQAFFKVFSNSATLFFGIICLISLAFRYHFYTYFCEHIQDACIVFFAFLSHEFLRKECIQIRNGIASAIVLYALVYLFNEKRLRFLFLILLAASFQQTAFVAVPLLIVHKTRTSIYTKFLYALFFFSCAFSILFPIKTILEILHGIGLLPGAIYNYLYWGQYARTMPLTNPQLLKQVCIVAWIFLHYEKYSVDKKVFFFFQVYLLCTVYYLVFRDFEILAGRFGSLLYGVEPLLLLRIIYVRKKHMFFKRLFLCGFYFCFFILNVATHAVGWLPKIV